MFLLSKAISSEKTTKSNTKVYSNQVQFFHQLCYIPDVFYLEDKIRPNLHMCMLSKDSLSMNIIFTKTVVKTIAKRTFHLVILVPLLCASTIPKFPPAFSSGSIVPLVPFVTPVPSVVRKNLNMHFDYVH